MHVRTRFPTLVACVLALSACSGGSGPSASTSAGDPAASASASASAAASATATAAPEPATVRLALDWTPNTNHTGFYVAQARGWYAEAGIDLRILPYNGATPESIVAGGQAECAISFEDSMTFAVAAGARLVSVMAILQRDAQALTVLEGSGIARPRQLDGKTYAGFGYPNEEPTVRSVIQADGGEGTFAVVTLNAGVYDALYAKQADFAITFYPWEGIEGRLSNRPLRYFRFSDFGFPEFYQVVLACDRDWLAREGAAARRFVGATVRGFEVAASDPAAAAADLVAQNPGVFEANPQLPVASAEYLAESGLYRDAEGRVGRQTLERWTAYPRFLYEKGLLTGPDGKPLAAPPDYGALFTNDFLP